MARLTKEQIAKLTPAERKKRAERLAYNKRYDAAKKKQGVEKRVYNAKYDARKSAEKVVSQTVIERAEVLLAELKVTEAKRDSIVKELRETFLK